jgi:hypothetical protein
MPTTSWKVVAIAVVAFTAVGCDRKSNETAKPAAVIDAGVAVAAAPDAGAGIVMVEVPEVRIRENGETTVRVDWLTPAGTTINDEAPFRVRWNRSDGLSDAPSDVKSTGSTVKNGYRLKVRPLAGAPNPTLAGEINIVVCDSVNHSVCLPVRRAVELGFVVAKDATAEVTVGVPLPAAR